MAQTPGQNQTAGSDYTDSLQGAAEDSARSSSADEEVPDKYMFDESTMPPVGKYCEETSDGQYRCTWMEDSRHCHKIYKKKNLLR